MTTDAEIKKNREIHAQKIATANAYFHDSAQFLSPPITRAAYSDRMAWIMASMSHIAYDQYDVDVEARQLFIAKLEGGGFKLIKTFNSRETDTQAFLAANDQFAVLAFRGTEVAKVVDMETDARAGKLATIQGEVHKGFANAYASVEKDIENQIKILKDIPLYITGHSLGAALATVCTQRLEHTLAFQERIAACYTFGSPRVGDSHFDMEFKVPIYRVVNTTDIVTVVPLLVMGYIHVGDVRYLGRKPGDLRRGIPIMRRVFYFLLAVFDLFGPLVGDHAIIEYRRKLHDAAQKRSIRRDE
jgi:Lipase (class 3)